MVYLVIVLLVVLLVVTAAWMAQRVLVFPGRFVPAQPLQLMPGVERLTLDTDEGEVEAWFVPGQGVSAEHPGPLVIYAYGNGERIDLHWPDKMPYVAMGVSVLLPEYRGYNRAAGSPSRAAILEDFTRWRQRMADRPDVDPSRIVYHGRSLGGGVVGELAKAQPPASLILESTFTSLADIAWDTFKAPRFLISDPFDVIGTLRIYPGPVLILHGRKDEVIPIAHAQRNHEASPTSRLVLYDTRHNDPTPPAYWHEIEVFLREAKVLKTAD